jgi:N-ethylmaleimide reductase
MPRLMESFRLGHHLLKNRVVMAPMTRSRAPGAQPNEMMAQYYAARASAGLIITEGTSPSPSGLGYARIPGLFNPQQAAGWRLVTEAVHKKGGKIFLQLMHTGRVGHPANMPAGSRILAPSALALGGNMWTDTGGMLPHPAPEEMKVQDIQAAVREFARSAELAAEAGFDGIELHAANGYLLEQFLNPNVNKRNDEYGRDNEGRMRFLLEVAKAAVAKIGAERIGVRISPYGVFNETGAFPGVDEFYLELNRRLSALGLAYMHVVDHSSMGAPSVPADLKARIRQGFKGAYILSGGYDRARAEHDLAEGKGDLVAFGRPFLSNPDLVEKLESGSKLRDPDPATFYTPGPRGYTEL